MQRCHTNQPLLHICTCTYDRQSCRLFKQTNKMQNNALGRNIPKTKVELHVHLEGAVRTETIWDLAKKKKIELPADSIEGLRDKLQIHNDSLAEFLEAFDIFLPTIIGDRDAIVRIAYEFSEDCAKQGAAYTEVRFSPQLLSNSLETYDLERPRGDLTPKCVVQAVAEGLDKGCKEFEVKVKMILCCLRDKPEWSQEVMELCTEMRDAGVVGIDIAGPEPRVSDEPTSIQHIHAFQEAERRGIHRTVHAGENGSHLNVKEAIESLHAERLGHGYHTIDDEGVYELAKQRAVHFEVCPRSSFMTNSVLHDPSKHPVIKFAADGVSFSISRDDPCITALTLDEEYHLLQEKMGFTRKQILQSILNGAKAAFLPDDEKQELMQQLLDAHQVLYGPQDDKA